MLLTRERGGEKGGGRHCLSPKKQGRGWGCDRVGERANIISRGERGRSSSFHEGERNLCGIEHAVEREKGGQLGHSPPKEKKRKLRRLWEVSLFHQRKKGLLVRVPKGRGTLKLLGEKKGGRRFSGVCRGNCRSREKKEGICNQFIDKGKEKKKEDGKKGDFPDPHEQTCGKFDYPSLTEGEKRGMNSVYSEEKNEQAAHRSFPPKRPITGHPRPKKERRGGSASGKKEKRGWEVRFREMRFRGKILIHLTEGEGFEPSNKGHAGSSSSVGYCQTRGRRTIHVKGN